MRAFLTLVLFGLVGMQVNPPQPVQPTVPQGRPTAPLPNFARGSISGVVLRGETSEPLPRVVVQLKPLDANNLGEFGWLDPFQEALASGPAAAANSNAMGTTTRGEFSFFGLGAGKYVLSVSGNQFREVPAPPILLAADQRLQDVIVRAVPVPAIEGRVLNPLGEPQAAVTVEAYRLVFTPFGRRLVLAKAVLTDDLGQYRLFWLSPGSYYVVASYGDRGPKPLIAGVTLTPNLSPADVGLASVYFPGEWSLADAESVRLIYGVDVGNTNIILRDSRSVAIRGRVGGSGSARLTLLSPNGNPVPGITRQAASSPGGSFEIRGVSPGPYVILAVVGTAKGKVSSRRCTLWQSRVDN